MQISEQKYRQFREIIDHRLEAVTKATIQLSATRKGDEISIAAQATLTGKPAADHHDPAAAKDGGGDAGTASKNGSRQHPRLRLVLTEQAVRYIGSNKLRYHRHVVRDFPGGLEGKDLSSGSGELNVTINLADLKREIESYLSDYSKERAFPGALPEVAFKDLAVVAFIQDDADKSILHAVSVPVK